MIVSNKILKQVYPDAMITVYSNNSINNSDSKSPEGYNLYIKELLGEDIQIIDWTYKGHFDLIFHGGGGIYFDKLQGKNLLLNKLLNVIPVRWISLIDNVTRIVLNKKKNISCTNRLGVGIGIGHYTNDSNLYYNHLAEIGSFNQLIVRDEFSKKFLDNHKLNRNKISLSTDLAFLNYWRPPAVKEHVEIERIGIIVKNALQESLVAEIFKFHDYLLSKGKEITFYSFDENYDSECRDVYSKYKFEQYIPSRYTSFLDKLDNEDLLVTTRAHGAIIGACLGIPSLILNLEVKLLEVSNMLKNSTILISSFEYSFLVEAYEKIEQNYPTYIQNLKQDFKANNKTANQIVELIDK